MRMFENSDYENLPKEELNDFFYENINLLEKFYKNNNILLAYLRLSELNNKSQWNDFLKYWIEKRNKEEFLIEDLNKFKNTKDKDLLNLIQLIYRNYK